jgi:hypothetical protein
VYRKPATLERSDDEARQGWRVTGVFQKRMNHKMKTELTCASKDAPLDMVIDNPNSITHR